ncbi:hypothetical protein M427DRAFT_41021 [Gonapodya prolifera JEL478]|uniref:RGS domain-containing protein n=1 Tax=Gonapodya prolifera (strain JEL478) TaxID=1344416 RepID=A0A139AVL0_GONPJ|nr:hypothetical protein M427DRAFT_41021 [Gonapodya prolifera JEL478]|eukprot:KXS20768.1 hypothetical protein M427DRAFT_41021 [Gonapodya prolifera JEL478]
MSIGMLSSGELLGSSSLTQPDRLYRRDAESPPFQAYLCGPLCLISFMGVLLYLLCECMVRITDEQSDAIRSRSFWVVLLQAIGMIIALVMAHLFYLKFLFGQAPMFCFTILHTIFFHLVDRSLVPGNILEFGGLIVRAQFLAIRLKVNRTLLENWLDTGSSDGNGQCLTPGGYFDMFPTLTVVTLLFFVLGFFELWQLRNLDDTHNIRKDLTIAIGLGLCLIITDSVLSYIGVASTYPELNRYFSSPTLTSIWIGITNTTGVFLPSIRAFRVLRRKHQAMQGDNPEEGNDILFTKVINKSDAVAVEMWQELKVFAVKDFAVESTIFIEELDRLQEETAKKILSSRRVSEDKNLSALRRESVRRPSTLSGKGLMPGSISSSGSGIVGNKCPPPWQKYRLEVESSVVPEDLVERWKQVYESYVKSGASNELNLSFSVAEGVRSKVSQNSFTMDMFDQCREETIKLLYENTFQKFMRARGSDLKVKKHVIMSQAVAEPTENVFKLERLIAMTCKQRKLRVACLSIRCTLPVLGDSPALCQKKIPPTSEGLCAKRNQKK